MLAQRHERRCDRKAHGTGNNTRVHSRKDSCEPCSCPLEGRELPESLRTSRPLWSKALTIHKRFHELPTPATILKRRRADQQTPQVISSSIFVATDTSKLQQGCATRRNSSKKSKRNRLMRPRRSAPARTRLRRKRVPHLARREGEEHGHDKPRWGSFEAAWTLNHPADSNPMGTCHDALEGDAH